MSGLVLSLSEEEVRAFIAEKDNSWFAGGGVRCPGAWTGLAQWKYIPSPGSVTALNLPIPQNNKDTAAKLIPPSVLVRPTRNPFNLRLKIPIESEYSPTPESQQESGPDSPEAASEAQTSPAAWKHRMNLDEALERVKTSMVPKPNCKYKKRVSIRKNPVPAGDPVPAPVSVVMHLNSPLASAAKKKILRRMKASLLI
jgi:hypothetical protein